jgi:hypothetical protein
MGSIKIAAVSLFIFLMSAASSLNGIFLNPPKSGVKPSEYFLFFWADNAAKVLP